MPGTTTPSPMPAQEEIDTLRRLAERVREISEDPANIERREAWYALDTGEHERVMILAEHGGIRDNRKPVSESLLECSDQWARAVEQHLRGMIYLFGELADDHVIEPYINVRWHITTSDYGVEVMVHQGGDEHTMGSRVWDAPLKDPDGDLAKLRPRTFDVDRNATWQQYHRLSDVLGDILTVRMRGMPYWSLGMTETAIKLVGLENFMLYMYDNPEGVHALMHFLCEDHMQFVDWLAAEGLLSLNNENDYIGSGSAGYTRDLPGDDWSQDMAVRPCDLWVLLESQETVGVSPELFEEFVFPYQQRIADRFGKLYYGCCEPVNNRWHVLSRFGNLARVSVSPWADQERMAEYLGRDYVFSRKPNPTLISTGTFDEAAIRDDISHTLSAAAGCRTEIIMKDVHTLHNQPGRLSRWVSIVREEIAKAT